jgi:hypothetical protein
MPKPSAQCLGNPRAHELRWLTTAGQVKRAAARPSRPCWGEGSRRRARRLVGDAEDEGLGRETLLAGIEDMAQAAFDRHC